MSEQAARPSRPASDNQDADDRRPTTARDLVERIHSPFLAKVILGTALTLTALAWWFSHSTVESSSQERFGFRTSEIESAIVQRMQGYETALWSGVGVMNSSDEVTRSEWNEFVETLDLDQRWPGIQGIGWSIPLTPAEIDEHEESIRAEGFPDYAVSPEGPRDQYSAIVYLEPFDWRNQRAFGYDMWSNEQRRAAMARARDDGRAATSPMITLVQETDEDVQKGFLTYVPVYENGASPRTVDERRAAFLGWVYAPFRMNDLMEGILGSTDQTVHFEIYDGREPTPEQLLYDSNPEFLIPGSDVELQRQVTVWVQGQPWTMVFSPGSAFSVSSDALPTFVAVAGLIIDGLLFYVISSLGMLSRRANALADERTAELRVANEQLKHRSNELEQQTVELQRSNEELRQFAHVASHDLQEPLRTMGSYSSLVLSTYGDELGVEGRRWLGYINGGAKRLSDLIREVLQFSTLDGLHPGQKSVDLTEVMDAVATDLSELIHAESAELVVDPLPEVIGDGVQLQRVLANLVHNAIKYHQPGVTPRVSVGGSMTDDDRWRIHVRDNGVGIEPELQGRVFEVFRRAVTDDAQPGTGMGLAICRKIIQAHGGDVGVVSSPGHGSEFWFTLPAKRTASPSTQPSTGPGQPASPPGVDGPDGRRAQTKEYA